MGKNRTERRAKSNKEEENEDIPDEEKWRLIDQSGILERVSKLGKQRPVEEDEDEAEAEAEVPCEEALNALLLIVPFSFLLLLMEVLARKQYGGVASLNQLIERVVTGVPILSVFVFYSNRYKSRRWMQSLLFASSIAVGTRMVYTVNRLNWTVVVQQGPPMATLWILTVVQLDLLPTVVGLAIVYIWAKWKDYQLVF